MLEKASIPSIETYPLVHDAALYAHAAHGAVGQRRKFVGTPYIEHPQAVAERVAQVPGISPEAVAAAWLHDVIEDTEVTPTMLGEHFPEYVVTLVLALTAPAKEADQSSRVHRLAVIEQLAHAPAEAQTIKCADILDNCSSLVARQGVKARPYLENKRDQLLVLTGACPELQSEALKVVVSGLDAIQDASHRS